VMISTRGNGESLVAAMLLLMLRCLGPGQARRPPVMHSMYHRELACG